MVNLNKIFLIGNLTKDPELRYTPQGTAVTTIRIAANRSFKDKTGQIQKDTCFVNVVVWGQMAESSNQYLQKGSQVFVEGRLQSRSWQNNEGQTRSVLEVVAVRVQFMSGGARQATGQEAGSDSETAEMAEIETGPKEQTGEAI